MRLRNSLRVAGELRWAHIECEQAHRMLSRAENPVAARQRSVLFDRYAPNLIALRQPLIAAAGSVSPGTYPQYMPKGEVRLEDPNGYCLRIGQAD
ncbi:MAG: hypothetical protein ABSF59_08515 [Candidatus Sulfotelmatobacter sp.]|jgi:hypothetical protein